MDSQPLHQPIETMDVSAHAVTRTRRGLRERATRGASDGERSHEVRSGPRTLRAERATRGASDGERSHEVRSEPRTLRPVLLLCTALTPACTQRVVRTTRALGDPTPGLASAEDAIGLATFWHQEGPMLIGVLSLPNPCFEAELRPWVERDVEVDTFTGWGYVGAVLGSILFVSGLYTTVDEVVNLPGNNSYGPHMVGAGAISMALGGLMAGPGLATVLGDGDPREVATRHGADVQARRPVEGRGCGGPAVGLSLVLRSPKATDPWARAKTDAQGRVAFEIKPAGPLEVAVDDVPLHLLGLVNPEVVLLRLPGSVSPGD